MPPALGARGDNPRHLAAKPSFLKKFRRKLERPMLFLSFAWFLILVTELVRGTIPTLHALGTALWALFVLYFGLRLSIVAQKARFLKRNWLFVLAIVVPVVRLFPLLHSMPLARALAATFGMQVVLIFASADQGLRSIHRVVGHKGVGYALTFTALVISAGAAGMYHFERDSLGPQGIHSYPKALWWVAMQITNIGSGFLPMTPGGQILCLGISIFAFAMFGYLTAIFAAFVIGKEAENPKSPIPSQTSLHQLSAEVALLRKSIEELMGRFPEAAARSASPPRMPEESKPITRDEASRPPGPHNA